MCSNVKSDLFATEESKETEVEEIVLEEAKLCNVPETVPGIETPAVLEDLALVNTVFDEAEDCKETIDALPNPKLLSRYSSIERSSFMVQFESMQLSITSQQLKQLARSTRFDTDDMDLMVKDFLCYKTSSSFQKMMYTEFYIPHVLQRNPEILAMLDGDVRQEVLIFLADRIWIREYDKVMRAYQYYRHPTRTHRFNLTWPLTHDIHWENAERLDSSMKD